MPKSLRLLSLVLALAAGSKSLGAQEQAVARAVSVNGRGPETYVLLSGMIGGVAGFRRLEARLIERGHRVIAIDPYHLSIDSADVSFAALARRVEVVLALHDVRAARMVGHAHGAGVMLRVAAAAQDRVAELYFLDVGALAVNRTAILAGSLRLIPIITRIPGGRGFVRDRLVSGLRQNAGRQEWLDAETERAYTEPVLDGIDQVIALVQRLALAAEPEPLAAVVSRIHVPATVLVGVTPRQSKPDTAEFIALAPLGARLRIERMAGVGHFPHEEAPDEVARYLLAPVMTVAVRRAGGAR